LAEAYRASEKLVAKLQAMRNAISPAHKVREELPEYYASSDITPFDQ
jgi:hypothetical protein